MDLGIIGGADGPTAIIVGGEPWGLALVVLLAAAAIVTAAWLLHRRRKK